MYNVQRPFFTQINQGWTDLTAIGKKVKQADSAGTT